MATITDGLLWRQTLQIAKEGTFGTLVPATRRMYVRDPRLTIERQPRPHRFATRTRDNVRAFTHGPVMAGGSFSFPMSADEMIEWLLMGVQGGVTPTGNTWTFIPGETLDSASVEWHDGAVGWAQNGVYVNQIHIVGSPGGENIVTIDLFGLDMVQQDLTEDLSERTPQFFEGWETKFYIDDFGDTPGTTAAGLTLLNWDITFNNNLGRKFYADNVNAQEGSTIGELAVDAKLTIEAASAITQAEFANWADQVLRTCSLEFGNNLLIPASSDNYLVRVDLPGAWSAVDLSGSDAGTRAYAMSYQYVSELTEIGSGIQFVVQTDRSTPFDDEA